MNRIEPSGVRGLDGLFEHQKKMCARNILNDPNDRCFEWPGFDQSFCSAKRSLTGQSSGSYDGHLGELKAKQQTIDNNQFTVWRVSMIRSGWKLATVVMDRTKAIVSVLSI